MTGQQTPDGGLPEVHQFEKIMRLHEYTSMVVCWVFMVKTSPSRSLGAFRPVINGFSKHLLNINAMVHTNMSPPKAAKQNNTGFYTEKFVSVILESWYPQKWFTNVPHLSSVSALVTQNLSKAQWLKK